MADYTYGQLQTLWINAGGSKVLAPLMAAIALAESGGNPQATNATDNGGTQTSWGLWQISNGTHGQPAPNILDPAVNAQQAVDKYKSQGLGAWGTYTSGAYRKFYNSTTPASSLPQGGGQGGQPATEDASIVQGITGTLGEASTLVHDAAEALNEVFEWFKPGQGWRAGAAVAAGGSGFLAFKSYQREDQNSTGAPLAVLFLGVALVLAYMAARPWPVSNDRPIRPAAYVHDILGGHPAVGPTPGNDTAAIEAGLWGVIGIWAVSKTSGLFGDIASGTGGILGFLKSLGKSAEEVGEGAAEGGVE